jgi:hypothetical protein
MARRFLAIITVLEGREGGLTPEHPIVLPPEFPPEVWPQPPFGGRPEHPIVLPPDSPGMPAHPIVLPPDVGVWPPPGTPSNPIIIPEPPPELGIWPPPGVVQPPMVPPTEAVMVVGVTPGYGLTWVKVKPVQELPVPTPYPKKS